jgi:hypothetical protein
MHEDFVGRLNEAFEGARMSDVARRLDIPHATVRNYYNGRLPAPEVLIKIARQTGVSLNWLLIGTGEMYAGTPGLSLGRIIEKKIEEIIDRKLSENTRGRSTAGDARYFDLDAAVVQYNEPQRVMREWFRHEGRAYPEDFGIVFFRGWESFSPEDKAAAVRDAKQMIDRVLRNTAADDA